MECTTNKAGAECQFMSKKGCTFSGGGCLEVAEQCGGCARIVIHNTGRYCAVYPDPALKWRRGLCNLATHAKVETAKEGNGKTVNPLKAAKRASRGK